MRAIKFKWDERRVCCSLQQVKLGWFSVCRCCAARPKYGFLLPLVWATTYRRSSLHAGATRPVERSVVGAIATAWPQAHFIGGGGLHEKMVTVEFLLVITPPHQLSSGDCCHVTAGTPNQGKLVSTHFALGQATRQLDCSRFSFECWGDDSDSETLFVVLVSNSILLYWNCVDLQYVLWGTLNLKAIALLRYKQHEEPPFMPLNHLNITSNTFFEEVVLQYSFSSNKQLCSCSFAPFYRNSVNNKPLDQVESWQL